MLKSKKTKHHDFSGAMTDISFLLIIFFLLSASLIVDGMIPVKDNRGESAAATVTQNQLLEIRIKNENRIEINDSEYKINEFTNLSDSFFIDFTHAVLYPSDSIRWQTIITIIDHIISTSNLKIVMDPPEAGGFSIGRPLSEPKAKESNIE